MKLISSTASAAFALLFAATALAAQEPVAAASDSFTLADALATARENNPAFLSQRNDVDVAQWRSRSAMADFLPSASLSNSYGYQASGERRFGSVGFGTQPSIYSSDYSLSLNLDVSGSKLLQPSVARAQERAARENVEGAAATLESNVTQQYLTVLQAQESVDQAQREVARTDEYVRLAQARQDVGAGTALDVRRAEVQQGRAQIGLVQARNTFATAKLALAQTVGAPAIADAGLSTRFALFEPRWEADELVAMALANNPNLTASRASQKAASTSVRQAQSSYLPSLSLGFRTSGSVYQASNLDPLVAQQLNPASLAQCQQDNQIRAAAGLPLRTCRDPSNPIDQQSVREQVGAQYGSFPYGYNRQPWTASVSVSLPLFTGLSRQVQVEQARAAAADARYQVRSQELQLRTDVRTALRNLETAYTTAQIQARVRATAQEELRLAQERFRFGAASSVEVTDAQTNLAEAERAEINAVYDFHKSLAALEAYVAEELR